MPMLSANCYAQNSNSPKNFNKLSDARQSLLNSPCEYFEILRASQFQFQNLKGLNINIEPMVAEGYHSVSHFPCFIPQTLNYIKAMGFDDTGENEHTLTIYLERIVPWMNCLDCSLPEIYFINTTWQGVVDVVLKIELTNGDGKVIYEHEESHTELTDDNLIEAFNEAYTNALELINWYKIASFLKESSAPKQQVKQESKEVEGYGNTALESTIVRWDVQSRPQGADVFWRIVSKTPSVKSTNNKYLQTTPYEATKSLDIRGLSYENSGDVRIILRCEKEGYHSQEKEFNVRMIIDQEEISAFFRLVKEE